MHHQIPKHETRNTFCWINSEVNEIWLWNLASWRNITIENFCQKILLKNVTWKLIPGNFQRIFCKMESEEVCILIWTNFDSFTITYLRRSLQRIIFPIEVVLNSLQTQKSLEQVCRSINVFANIFDICFSFVMWHKLAKFHQQTVLTTQVIQ